LSHKKAQKKLATDFADYADCAEKDSQSGAKYAPYPLLGCKCQDNIEEVFVKAKTADLKSEKSRATCCAKCAARRVTSSSNPFFIRTLLKLIISKNRPICTDKHFPDVTMSALAKHLPQPTQPLIPLLS